MPVYNGMPYLQLAVESILRQTYRNFEFIIIDDCSSDDSLRYLKSLRDDRIVLIQQLQNGGVTRALQEGMVNVRGTYVARLDADDIAMPERLQVQIDFLDANPEYGLIGSSYSTIDVCGNVLTSSAKWINDLEVRWKMLFKNPFVHSTVMFRKSIIDQHKLNYQTDHGEDYHLWSNILQYTKGCILEDTLVKYRIHEKSWTNTQIDNQLNAGKMLSFILVNRILAQTGKHLFTENNYTDLIGWRKNEVNIFPAHLEIYLLDAFSEIHKGNPQLSMVREKVLGRVWRRLKGKVIFNPMLGIKLLKGFIRKHLNLLLI